MRSKKPVPLSHEQRVATDRIMRAAVVESLDGLACRPEPRRQFDRVLSDEGATPWAPMVAMMATLAHGGQSAERLAAFGRALTSVALLLAPPPSADALTALRREQEEDAATDIAQARAWAERTPTAYGVAAEASVRLAQVQLETAHVLLHLAHPRAARAAVPQPRGLAA